VTILGTTVRTVPGTVPRVVRNVVSRASWAAVLGPVFGANVTAISRPVWTETRTSILEASCLLVGKAIVQGTATAICEGIRRWTSTATWTAICAATMGAFSRARFGPSPFTSLRSTRKLQQSRQGRQDAKYTKRASVRTHLRVLVPWWRTPVSVLGFEGRLDFGLAGGNLSVLGSRPSYRSPLGASADSRPLTPEVRCVQVR
jgi:hypothetical protein